MKFIEYILEENFVQLLAEQGYPHVLGKAFSERM